MHESETHQLVDATSICYRLLMGQPSTNDGLTCNIPSQHNGSPSFLPQTLSPRTITVTCDCAVLYPMRSVGGVLIPLPYLGREPVHRRWIKH